MRACSQEESKSALTILIPNNRYLCMRLGTDGIKTMTFGHSFSGDERVIKSATTINHSQISLFYTTENGELLILKMIMAIYGWK